MSGKGVRPKTPRVEIHDAQIPEWQKAAEARGVPLAQWIREACEAAMRKRRTPTKS